MVKGRALSSPSEPRCLPLASPFLAAAHLKPSRSPSSLPILLRRRRLERRARMDPLSPSSPLHPSARGGEPYFSENSVDYRPLASEIGASWQRSSKSARTPSPAPTCSDDSSDEDQEHDFACGRQRLLQYRVQVSGKVTIPETWGREQQLQEWVSYGIVEDALHPVGLMTARTALVSECQGRGRQPMPAQAAISADVEVS